MGRKSQPRLCYHPAQPPDQHAAVPLLAGEVLNQAGGDLHPQDTEIEDHLHVGDLLLEDGLAAGHLLDVDDTAGQVLAHQDDREKQLKINKHVGVLSLFGRVHCNYSLQKTAAEISYYMGLL